MDYKVLRIRFPPKLTAPERNTLANLETFLHSELAGHSLQEAQNIHKVLGDWNTESLEAIAEAHRQEGADFNRQGIRDSSAGGTGAAARG